MKFFTLLLLAVTITSAHAAFLSEVCSNSSASIHWDRGTENNIHLLQNADAGTVLTLAIDQVDFEMTEKFVLSEVSRNTYRCGTAQTVTRVFAATAVITPSKKDPKALDPLNEKEITLDVICTSRSSNQGWGDKCK